MAEARTRHITDRIETKQELVETMFFTWLVESMAQAGLFVVA